MLNGDKELNIQEKIDLNLDKNIDSKYDFKYIIGQEYAKRALEIAASG